MVGDSKRDTSCDLTVYYDGSCPLCRAEIAYFSNRLPQEAVQFEDVSHANPSLPDGLERTDALARFHVQRGDGALVSGAAGFAEMWARAPGWRWLARLARLPGMMWMLERIYRSFLVLRPVLVRVLGPILQRKSASRKRVDP